MFSCSKPTGIAPDRGHRSRLARRILLSLVISFAILTPILLGGCGGTTQSLPASRTAIPPSPTPLESEMPFETIAQGDRSRYESQEPALIVVSSPEEIPKVADLFWANPPGIGEQLQALDYKTHIALVVFEGKKNTGGYRVEVEQITRRGDEVICHALSLTPKPGVERSTEVTSPFHLVQITKEGDWQEMRFTLSVTTMVSP